MPTLRSTFSVHVRTSRSAVLQAGTQSYNPIFSKRQTLEDGVAINQADEVVTIEDKVTAASPEEWDLMSGGAGDHNIDGLEGEVSFQKIKTLVIKNESTTAGEILIVGAAAANAFDAIFNALAGGKVEVPPNGCIAFHNPSLAGWLVNATHKMLKIAAAAGTDVEFKIKIVGIAS